MELFDSYVATCSTVDYCTVYDIGNFNLLASISYSSTTVQYGEWGKTDGVLEFSTLKYYNKPMSLHIIPVGFNSN